MSSIEETPEIVRRRHGVHDSFKQYATETARLLDTIDDIFYVCTESGSLRRWNKQLSKRTGYSDEDLSSKTLQSCFEQSHRQRVDEALADASTGGTVTWNASLETARGTTTPFEFTATVEETADGTVVLTGTGRPVSDRSYSTGPKTEPYVSEIRQIQRLLTEESLDTDERLKKLLELGRKTIGARQGFLSVIDESSGTFTITDAVGEEIVPTDTEIALSATLCKQTIERTDLFEFRTSDQLPDGEPCASELQRIETYVGGRIVVNGNLHGTLCFVGWEDRDGGLSAHERSFLQDLRGSIRHIVVQEHQQQRLERAIEAAPIGISIAKLDDAGQPLTYVNERFQEITGYSEAEIVGERCCALQGEQTDPETACRIQRAIEARETETVEIQNYRKDGSMFWNRVSVAPLEDESGEVNEFVAFQEDVTERKEREQELHRSERQFEAVFNDPRAFVGLADPDGSVYHVNQTAFDLVEAEPEEVYGERAWNTPWWNHDPELQKEVRASIERAADGEYVEVEADLSSISDGELVISGTVRPVTDDEGAVVSLIVSARDVTETRQRERELEETNERLNAIIEASSAALVAIDPEDTVELWNPAAERIFGWSEEEVLGEAVPFFPDESDKTARRAREVAHHPTTASFEATRQCKDGSLVDVRVSSATVRDSEGAVVGYFCALQDISERKAYEQQLEQYKSFTDDLLDAIDDVFYVLDEDGHFRRWNETLCEVTGYSDEELASMQEIDLFEPSNHEHVKTAVRDVFDSGSSRVEASLLTKDGDTIPHEFTASTVENPDGESRLTGIGRDISERVTAERQLREHERQLTTLMNNLPGMVYRCANEPDWPMEFVSDGCADLTGYDADQLESGAVSWAEDVIHDGNQGLWETVQQCLDERRPFRVTYPIETADGEIRWCKEQGRGIFDEDGTLEALEGVIIDVTERKRRQQEAERTRQLLQQAQQLASVGGCVVSVENECPGTISWSTDISSLLDISEDASITFEEVVDSIAPSDQQRVETAVREAIQTGAGFDIECRIRVHDNEQWIRAIGEPVAVDGQVSSLQVAVQEITDRKHHQLALESIQDATRGLLGAESRSEVSRLVATVAAQVLAVDGAAMYTLDSEASTFEPLADAGSFADLCGGVPAISVDTTDSLVWESFISGTTTEITERTESSDPLSSEDNLDGIAVPAGDHGVFVALSRGDGIDESTHQLVETLVAAAESAFDRLESEVALRERDAELETRNDRLQRQMQINDIIRSINKSLIRADSREAVETAVCDRLVSESGIKFAWIGELDSGSGIEPRTWAGTHPEYLDGVTLDGTKQSPEPAYRTAREGEPTVVENVLGDVQAAHWRKQALLFDFHSVVCVPMIYDDYTYGVLAVYADSSGTFGTLEETVFEELGETIANSINAVENRRALHTDTVIEIALSLDAPEAFCHQLADRSGCQIEYDGLAADTGETTRLFFTVTEDSAEAVERVLEDLFSVSEYSKISTAEDGTKYVATVTGTTVVSQAIQQNGRLCSMEATADGVEAVVELPPETDVREFVSLLDDQFEAANLTSRRTVEREQTVRQDHVSALMERLTERQQQVLRTAYFGGFFEWPRESTGQEVADLLDVSQPTVNRHLRLGQGRLLSQLFDNDAHSS